MPGKNKERENEMLLLPQNIDRADTSRRHSSGTAGACMC